MPQVTKASLLTQARALLEKGWCQGEYALTAHGVPIEEGDQKASRWCLSGALNAATRFSYGRSDVAFYLSNQLEILVMDQIGRGIIDWNDAPTRTQAEVLALMDKAIASHEAQELVEVAAGLQDDPHGVVSE